MKGQVMANNNTKVLVAKFEDSEQEYGRTAIRIVELNSEIEGQLWGEHYNETHEEKIASARFYSLDYLKDRWLEIH